MTPLLIGQIIQALLVAEPPLVSAIHSLLTGTGSADLATLQADTVAWQAMQANARKELGLPEPGA
jgi:hypothetical protein